MSDTERTENLQKETTENSPEQPVGKRRKLGGFRLVLVIVCVCAACFSAYKLISILREYKQGADTYSAVEEAAFKPAGHAEKDDEDNKGIVPQIDFEALKRISDKSVGWLSSPGTVINYPVAKTDNNTYYLTHLIDGSSNANGCLFVDYRNADGYADQNTIIYGHRMKNGAMLSGITKYNKQDYYDQYPEMYLITQDGSYVLQIFAAYVTEATSNAYMRTFDSDRQFADWVDTCVKRSYVKTDVSVGPGDHVITLSTCVKADDTRRFVVQAKMVKIED